MGGPNDNDRPDNQDDSEKKESRDETQSKDRFQPPTRPQDIDEEEERTLTVITRGQDPVDDLFEALQTAKKKDEKTRSFEVPHEIKEQSVSQKILGNKLLNLVMIFLAVSASVFLFAKMFEAIDTSEPEQTIKRDTASSPIKERVEKENRPQAVKAPARRPRSAVTAPRPEPVRRAPSRAARRPVEKPEPLPDVPPPEEPPEDEELEEEEEEEEDLPEDDYDDADPIDEEPDDEVDDEYYDDEPID